MCGICGFVDVDGRLASEDRAAAVGEMTATLLHRGPDDGGCWTDGTGVALGHRRLAVIDVSPMGHQPMASRDGRIVLSFNGEIYNYRELRAELMADGHAFRGGSDTEVLVEALAHWGSARVLRRLNGIFAFAAWDRSQRRLLLARDPLGVKPLYWGRYGSGLMFASESKALRALPGWDAALDSSALHGFLRYGQVVGAASIYRHVRQLPPGHALSWSWAEAPTLAPYFDLHALARSGQAAAVDLSDTEAVEHLDALLDAAVGGQMVADVPLGAFLSGGIDSATVVALMQRRATRPVRTFTIGFAQPDYDEAPDAAAIARHLGTEHTELYVSERDLLDMVPRLADIYDEPFADASQLPTLLISALAREHVIVALSGDGGDELFAGYNRHRWTQRLWRAAAAYPSWLRQAAGHAASALPPAWWHAAGRLRSTRARPRQLADKVQKAARVLAQPDLASAYDVVRSVNPNAARLLAEVPAYAASSTLTGDLDPLSAMLVADALGYLPDDVLTKVDRASMRYGLEVRVPLLDLRVVDFAFRLPTGLKLRDGQGKWLLRQVLHRHLPEALVKRPKAGFSVPMDDWLRGPLRDWSEALLQPALAGHQGLLDPAALRALWHTHLSARADCGNRLWPVLVLLAWLERWGR